MSALPPPSLAVTTVSGTRNEYVGWSDVEIIALSEAAVRVRIGADTKVWVPRSVMGKRSFSGQKLKAGTTGMLDVQRWWFDKVSSNTKSAKKAFSEDKTTKALAKKIQGRTARWKFDV